MIKVSLIMPVYNEGATLKEALKALGTVSIPVPWELIICDDGSTDGATDTIIREWVPEASRVRVLRARCNRGKGSALRRGFAVAEGDILGVQDADLEYDPQQIPSLLGPILDGSADVVFGTRQFGAHAAYSYWYVVGNRFISTVACACSTGTSRMRTRATSSSHGTYTDSCVSPPPVLRSRQS
jgi:dolichol-phosphate hexosyltransferase